MDYEAIAANMRAMEAACLAGGAQTTARQVSLNSDQNTRDYYNWLRRQAPRTALMVPTWEELTAAPMEQRTDHHCDTSTCNHPQHTDGFTIADLQPETAIDESVYDLIGLLSALAVGQSCEWDSGAGGVRCYTRIS